MSTPEVELGALPHADGSAGYKWRGFELSGAVNGPIEVQRRDELPEEAFIEVNVRPANGVGGTRERHIESLLASTLRSVILTKLHPRTLIQITLQILSTPESASSSAPVPQYASHLPSLPHLLHTALLALLNANIPLAKTFTAVLVGVDEKGTEMPWPAMKLLEELNSLHVFAISSKGEMLVVEGEGEFGIEELQKVAKLAKQLCLGQDAEDGGMEIDATTKPLQSWLRHLLEEEVHAANRWREHYL